jgi:hypothetical protein
MKKRIIGLLLHIANSSPPILGREEFYAIKTKLLERYGTFVRNDLQYIEKGCFACDGTGRYPAHYERGFCRRCWGSGLYEAFYVILRLYRLGDYEFHTPTKRQYVTAEDPARIPHVRGYIEHKRFRRYLSSECAYWLFLIYDRRTFRYVFGRSGHCSRKYTPLVITSNLLYRWRYGYRSWDRLKERCNRRIDAFRKRNEPIALDLHDDYFPF